MFYFSEIIRNFIDRSLQIGNPAKMQIGEIWKKKDTGEKIIIVKLYNDKTWFIL